MKQPEQQPAGLKCDHGPDDICRPCEISDQLEQLARRTGLECIGKTGSEVEAIILGSFKKVQELTRKENTNEKNTE